MPTPEAARGRSQWRTAATALSLAVGLTLSLWTGLAAWSGEAQWSWLLTVGAGAGALLIAHGLARLTPGGRQLSFCLYLVLALCLPLYGVLGSLALTGAAVGDYRIRDDTCSGKTLGTFESATFALDIIHEE